MLPVLVGVAARVSVRDFGGFGLPIISTGMPHASSGLRMPIWRCCHGQHAKLAAWNLTWIHV